MEEKYEGELFPGIPVISGEEMRERYPEWVLCLSPNDINLQAVPEDIGPEDVFYPTNTWFREGIL